MPRDFYHEFSVRVPAWRLTRRVTAVVVLAAAYVTAAQAQAVSPLTLAQNGSRTEAQAQSSQMPAPQLEWTFEEVIRAAIARHPLVEAARARLTAAQGGRVTAGALPNPVATYWVENSSFPGQELPFGVSREASTYLTLPLEPFFQRGPRIRRAEQEVKAADADLAAARRQVALDAAQAFFRVALAQVAVEATEENRKGLEHLVLYNQSRVQEGATPEVDLIRAQVELDRAATDAVLAEVDLGRSRAALWPFLSASSPSRLFRVVLPSPPAAGARMPSVADFQVQAQERRPELLAGRARVASANAEAGYQRRLALRQLGASFGFKSISSGNSATPGSNSMVAGISISVPLFDRNRGEVQRASGEMVAAQQDLAWKERTVAAGVQAAYDAAQQLSSQVSRLQGTFLNRASEADQITLAAYQEGGASLLQVLDASRSLAEARLTYYRALFAERQSVFELALAAGHEPADALTTLHASSLAPSGAQGGNGDRP
jgi:outer membrane protein, heavy metal efflux system